MPQPSNIQAGAKSRSDWTHQPHSPLTQWMLDAIPGCIAWVALIFCIVSAVIYPRVMLLIATLVAAYSALRFLLAGFTNLIGTRRIKQQKNTNWYAEYTAHKTEDTLAWDAIHHVVIIPNYEESLHLLETTLDHLARCYGARENMTVVLAMEAAEPAALSKAEILCRSYQTAFTNIFFTMHPEGIQGELQCKSANQRWVGAWIADDLIEVQGYAPDHIVVTTMDADTRWHEDYFTALTYHFATDSHRYHRFWQAPIRYHNNVWQINPLLRLVNAYSAAFELAYLAADWWLPMPISSYSLSLQLLINSDFWDGDAIADEWHIYIKAFFRNDATTRIQPIFLPFSAHATTGKTILETVKNRYRQTLRHAWGSKEVGYIIGQMQTKPDVSRRRSFLLLLRVAHDILLSGAGWIIVSLGSILPLVLHPDLARLLLHNRWQDPVYVVFQAALLLVFVLGVIFWYQDLRTRPPRKHSAKFSEHLWTISSFFLLPLLTLIFVALPVLHAQTRLLLGLPLKFRVSPKL